MKNYSSWKLEVILWLFGVVRLKKHILLLRRNLNPKITVIDDEIRLCFYQIASKASRDEHYTSTMHGSGKRRLASEYKPVIRIYIYTGIILATVMRPAAAVTSRTGGQRRINKPNNSLAGKKTMEMLGKGRRTNEKVERRAIDKNNVRGKWKRGRPAGAGRAGRLSGVYLEGVQRWPSGKIRDPLLTIKNILKLFLSIIYIITPFLHKNRS